MLRHRAPHSLCINQTALNSLEIQALRKSPLSGSGMISNPEGWGWGLRVWESHPLLVLACPQCHQQPFCVKPFVRVGANWEFPEHRTLTMRAWWRKGKVLLRTSKQNRAGMWMCTAGHGKLEQWQIGAKINKKSAYVCLQNGEGWKEAGQGHNSSIRRENRQQRQSVFTAQKKEEKGAALCISICYYFCLCNDINKRKEITLTKHIWSNKHANDWSLKVHFLQNVA